MSDNTEELLDQLDACVFTGDSLYSRKMLVTFETYLERWQREVKVIREHIEEEE